MKDVADSQRPQRQRNPLAYLQEYEVNLDDNINDDGELIHNAFIADLEPVTLKEAIKNQKWEKSMREELDAIERNNTWALTDLPQGHKAIDVKWVFKTKLGADGAVERYKARLRI